MFKKQNIASASFSHREEETFEKSSNNVNEAIKLIILNSDLTISILNGKAVFFKKGKMSQSGTCAEAIAQIQKLIK